MKIEVMQYTAWMSRSRADWYVYMLLCADATYYTGIARDVARRLREHNENNRLAARYTRVRRPVQLVYTESYATRAAAAKREAMIKRLSRTQKQLLIQQQHD